MAAFKINFEDRDPWRTAMGDTAQAGQGRTEDRGQTGGSSVKEKVLKMSSLVDQMDESELLPDIKTVKKWHAQCIRVMGSMPDESEEPSAGQLVGLAKRMSGGGPPYVDFAVTVFLPYGRRSEKSHSGPMCLWETGRYRLESNQVLQISRHGCHPGESSDVPASCWTS